MNKQLPETIGVLDNSVAQLLGFNFLQRGLIIRAQNIAEIFVSLTPDGSVAI